MNDETNENESERGAPCARERNGRLTPRAHVVSLSFVFYLFFFDYLVCGPPPQVHICTKCDSPIAVYGMLLPCRHVFALECAHGMVPTCYLCFAKVEEVRKIVASETPLHLCGVCLRGYESQDELSELVKANGGKCCQGQRPKAETQP